jgi:hypothetical protein
MEIRDYLRAIRRILWLVIAIPVAAGLLVGGFIELQPSAYQANATAVVPAITANGISQSAASQYASTFKDVLTSQSVVPLVSQKFNIPQSELVTGLSSSTTTASSNLINVVLIGKKGQDLVDAVHEAAVDTMNAIAYPQLVQAQNAVTNSRTLLQNAQTAIFNFQSTYGNAAPQLAYNNQASRVSQDESQLATARINNDVTRENALNAIIATDKLTLAKFGQQLQQYLPLASALSAAQSANDHATSDLVAAQSLIATDSAPGTVTTRDIGRLSKLSDVIKFGAIGLALALIMMLGLILILELMRSGRRQAVPVDGQQSAFAWPPQAAQTRAAGPPATPAMAAPAAPAAPSAPPRDPWRATPAASGDGIGNGNGNGHSTGTVPADLPDADAEPQRAGSGLFRRR